MLTFFHSPTRRISLRSNITRQRRISLGASRISLQTSPTRGSLFSRTGRAPMRRNPALCRWVSSPNLQYFQRPLRRMQSGRPAHHFGIWTPFLSCGFLHEAFGSFDRTHPAGQAAHCYQCDHVVSVTPHEKALPRAFFSLWFIVRWYNADRISNDACALDRKRAFDRFSTSLPRGVETA